MYLLRSRPVYHQNILIYFSRDQVHSDDRLYGTGYPDTVIDAVDDRPSHEIISDILKINPEYNLGELLQWLRIRTSIVKQIAYTDIYNITLKHINYIWEHPNNSVEVYSRSPESNSVLNEFFKERGLSSSIIDDEAVIVSFNIKKRLWADLLVQFMNVRMASTYYLITV